MNPEVNDAHAASQQLETPQASYPWSWTNFAVAAALLPLGFFMWVAGMMWGVFNPDPVATLCLIASPFVFFAGVIWMVVLVAKRSTVKRAKRRS